MSVGAMTGMIAIDPKKGDRANLHRPLMTFIMGAFPEQQEEMSLGVDDVSKMREKILAVEKSEKGAEQLLRYYLQMSAMDCKLPINENQIHVTFTWYDSFYKDSVFSGKRGSAANSLYERSCVLFNYAAVSSQIAASQNLDTDDGLKIAAKYFQVASGAFAQLRDKLVPTMQKVPTPDLSPEVLASLTTLMQAQAQECIYIKAVADKMKEKVTCRLAGSAADFYGDAYKAMSNVNLKGTNWDKWTAICLAKQNYMSGLSEYYQSLNAKASKAIGEELARLTEAHKLLGDAVKQSAGSFECKVGIRPKVTGKDILSKVDRAQAAAKKDNEFIYHERVPNISDLPAVGRAPVAKPTPVATELEGWSDVFNKLVPLNVQQAATMYASRKDHLIHLEITKLREATNQLNNAMNQMNLPAAIEDLGGKEIPVSLIEKSGDVRTKGGLMSLRQSFDELPQLLQRNEEIITETLKELNAEEASDKHLRGTFGAKWNRTKSEDLTKSFKDQGDKYQSILTNARNADKIVREKFETNIRAIDILSKDESTLIDSIPVGGAQSLSGQGQKAVASLKSFMDQIKLLKGERDALEQKFKAGGDTEEIIEKFSQLNTESNLFNDEGLSTEHLEKTYGPQQAAVVDSVRQQDELIAKITCANDEFVQSKTGATSDPRSEMMSELAQGYDAFIELMSNLAEGTKFYNNLTKILTTYQSNVNDFILARNTEKEDLMKSLQGSLANKAPPTRPDPPQFHQQAAQSSAPAPLPQATASPMGQAPAPQAPPLAAQGAPQQYNYGGTLPSGGVGYQPSYNMPYGMPAYGGYYTYPGPAAAAYGNYPPAAQYPPGQYPPGQNTRPQYPPGQNAGAQYPPGQYPPSQYPPGQYPPYTGPK
ncbi:programmed cell death 6-interacting protein-like isoform X3 [Bolinopsis microptera]|uniref:programmed cell death 6-interacting protein-like isoform X3 n=1 Tax=Bolinopsis microptera TaxID=2820187 RepID=UPI00307A49D5